mmetsp:Transcript_158771/g.280492  ORF Transcript_158771/g.280492 Transcript_158771/m.280492 type:complete len:854 (+) Transcript_158771:111-2672(+)
MPTADAPTTLYVASPNDKCDFSGEYTITQDIAHDYPVWIHRGGKKYIYTGTNGFWMIGSESEKVGKGKSFEANTGNISTSSAHSGIMPHRLKGRWDRYESAKKTWINDADIIVSDNVFQVAPPTLYIVSPTDKCEFSGEFNLVPSITANGYPVWVHKAGRKWIYTGNNSFWMVGSESDKVGKGKSFDANTGNISTSSAHFGAMPHANPGKWDRYEAENKKWVGDKTIVCSTKFADVAPTTLYVCSPTDKCDFSGQYNLLPLEEMANGYPVWCHRSGKKYIYTGNNGFWMIGSESEQVGKGKTFDANTGNISTSAAHYGKMPHCLKGHWDRYVPDGKTWNPDKTISVGVDIRELAPKTLYAVIPNERHEYGGEFELVPDQEANGFPVWVLKRALSGTPRKWIYTGREGHWMIGKSSETDSGCISSNAPHDGMLPHCMKKWEKYLSAESKWVLDKGILLGTNLFDLLPERLKVSSPTERKEFTGEYVLQRDQRANDYPTWYFAEGRKWLYTGKNGFWMIGSESDKIGAGKSFDANTGNISSNTAHNGILPHCLMGRWDRYEQEGKNWVADSTISVVDAYTSLKDDDSVKKTESRASNASLKIEPAAAMPINARMRPHEETEISILPTTKWQDIKPTRGLLEELRCNELIRQKVREIETIAMDVELKVQELRFSKKVRDLAALLSDDELAAIVAYTHDLSIEEDNKAGNLFYEENEALRKRASNERASMIRTWGVHMYYTLAGLGKLPNFEGVVYRGVPSRKMLEEYEQGRPIQWGAWSSTTTSLEACLKFTGTKGVIFKIKVFTGKDICKFSFFAAENEILLSPNHKFIVTESAYEDKGYTFVDLLESRGTNYVY